MAEQGLFYQNVIAVVWDFDRTLSPNYMQKPLFEEYDVDETQFWNEVNALPAYYARAGVRMHPDTAYLNHILTYVAHGKFPGLTNAKLRELGGKLEFFPGLPGFFDELHEILEEPRYADADIRLEHYVVSTGLGEMIRGSAIHDKLAGLWASEYVESPAEPGYDLNGEPGNGPIAQIAGALDNTTKTRALFEINKGVGKHAAIKVNTMIPEEHRRVPFKNMIYIADGPSDVPSFSVVKKHGGLAYAVYDPNSHEQFAQVVDLHDTGRVHDYGEANYTSTSKTYRWLNMRIRKTADRIIQERTTTTESQVGPEPTHIIEKNE